MQDFRDHKRYLQKVGAHVEVWQNIFGNLCLRKGPLGVIYCFQAKTNSGSPYAAYTTKPVESIHAPPAEAIISNPGAGSRRIKRDCEACGAGIGDDSVA